MVGMKNKNNKLTFTIHIQKHFVLLLQKNNNKTRKSNTPTRGTRIHVARTSRTKQNEPTDSCRRTVSNAGKFRNEKLSERQTVFCDLSGRPNGKRKNFDYAEKTTHHLSLEVFGAMISATHDEIRQLYMEVNTILYHVVLFKNVQL